MSIARTTVVAAAALALLAALSGCKAIRGGGGPAPVADTMIQVENHGFPDVVVYAVASGDPYRLGMVTGSGSAKFTLPARFSNAGTLQLLARPIAGRAFLLPAVSVSPGDVVEVSIESTPAQSRVIVLPRYEPE